MLLWDVMPTHTTRFDAVHPYILGARSPETWFTV